MRLRFHTLCRPPFVILFFVAVIALQLFAPRAWAATVTKVKDKTVLIDLEGEASSAQVGDKYFVMIGGKKRGLVTITKIKSGKALATLDKGVAQPGTALSLAKAANPAAQQQGSDDWGVGDKKRPAKRKGLAGFSHISIGGLLGYNVDAENVKLSTSSGSLSESVALTGSGYSFKGFGTVPLAGNFGITARTGFETFKVAGTSKLSLCTGSNRTACTTDITYFDLDALLRYQFPFKSFTPYAQGGLGIVYPLSKSTTALNPNIGMTTAFYVGGGVEVAIGTNSFIPVNLEYVYFMPSSNVNSHEIAVSAGYALKF